MMHRELNPQTPDNERDQTINHNDALCDYNLEHRIDEDYNELEIKAMQPHLPKNSSKSYITPTPQCSRISFKGQIKKLSGTRRE